MQKPSLTLILTEKPSVARDFAKALQADRKRDGYVEGNGVIITWAVGHLLELAEPGEYDERWIRWSLASLPILPHPLRYKPIAKTERQLRIVQEQLARSDVSRIVIATDAGREGEVIARTILHTVDYSSKEVYRFWTSQALTPQVIRESLGEARPAADFDRLWRAGQARQTADWLVGMNFSRAATLKLRDGGSRERNVYSVGRVQTAVLALLVDRKRERDDFRPQPYWLLRAHFTNESGAWWGIWFRGEVNRFLDVEAARKTLAAVEGRTGHVASVRREKKRTPPPFLYSLTDLQRDANTRLGLSAKETLDTAQSLYEERKCLSYPRTDARVLGSKSVGLVRKIVERLKPYHPALFDGVDEKRLGAANKRVFNDAKLTDHHALIPLAPLPSAATPREARIFDMVLKRFAAVFHPDFVFEATEVVTEVAGESFRTRGRRPLEWGWKVVYGEGETSAAQTGDGNAGAVGGDEGSEGEEEADLPPLRKGDPAAVAEARLEERKTQPSPEYSEALLLKDMTNPSRYVAEEDLQKIFRGEVGLGTQATRAQIIETMLARGYVVREGKKLYPTEKGCRLTDSLRRFTRLKAVTTPEETARWELELERIAQGSGDAGAFTAAIVQFVEESVDEFKRGRSAPASPQGNGAPGCEAEAAGLGTCPVCGGTVIEGKRGYGCGNWREKDGACRFVVWKIIAGREIGKETLSDLLARGLTEPLTGFVSQAGQPFNARLKLNPAENFRVEFVFE